MISVQTGCKHTLQMISSVVSKQNMLMGSLDGSFQKLLVIGKSHGQRNLVGYSPWGHKRVGHALVGLSTVDGTS